MGPFLLLALTLLFSATLWPCDGGKVLVFPLDGSHWLNMKILVEALHSRGHNVTVIRTSNSWYISETSSHYMSITIKQEHSQNIEEAALMTDFLKRSLEIRRRQGSIGGFLDYHQNLNQLLRESNNDVAKILVSILEDKSLIKQLNETKYDVLLADPAFAGGPLLGHFLKLPMVFNARWALNGESHFSIAPSPLSYVPQMFSHNSDKMDFSQRVTNIISHMTLVYMYYFVTNAPYQSVCDRYFGPGVDVLSVMQKADIWLIRGEFTFEFPRPTMPNVVYIGGFQGKPSKPLPPDLEEFMQSSGDHGVVVMTLGTLLGDLGPELSDAIAAAFAKLPQKVVWRHVGERPSTLGNNTMLVKWLPQNDILGHPKTKLFISHGGTNGLYEAIYHGVPVLGIPLIFDQDDNFVRLMARGAAEMVEISTLSVESMTRALENILDPDQLYRQNMHKLSQLLHDKPVKPLDSAVFWIEFVMRNKGAAHLRTESYQLPWYAYHCLDVMLFFSVTGLLIVSLIWIFCRLLIRFVMGMLKNKTKRE